MENIKFVIEKSARIDKLISAMYEKLPEIEADRGVLVTESYKATEGLPLVKRRSAAFAHILRNLPIVIRENELIAGSTTVTPRGCQVFPEYSYEWLEAEFETVATREADPFYISEETKAKLREVYPYWKGKTVSDLAKANMAPEAYDVFMNHGIFTVGNYFYNGIGHVCVQYDKVINHGYEAIINEAKEELAKLSFGDGDYVTKRNFLDAVIESCEAVIEYAHRYSVLASQMAEKEHDMGRKMELRRIADACAHVPEKGARTFFEACQSFWFIQMLLQTESSGHSISPGRFDQYMYPFYKKDMDDGVLSLEEAQELIDQTIEEIENCIGNYDDVIDIMMYNLGLEGDYILDLMY